MSKSDVRSLAQHLASLLNLNRSARGGTKLGKTAKEYYLIFFPETHFNFDLLTNNIVFFDIHWEIVILQDVCCLVALDHFRHHHHQHVETWKFRLHNLWDVLCLLAPLCAQLRVYLVPDHIVLLCPRHQAPRLLLKLLHGLDVGILIVVVSVVRVSLNRFVLQTTHENDVASRDRHELVSCFAY